MAAAFAAAPISRVAKSVGLAWATAVPTELAANNQYESTWIFMDHPPEFSLQHHHSQARSSSQTDSLATANLDCCEQGNALIEHCSAVRTGLVLANAVSPAFALLTRG